MAVLGLGRILGCFRHLSVLLHFGGAVAWIVLLVMLVTLNLYEYGWLLYAPSSKTLTDKDRLMIELGFGSDPILYPHSHHRTDDLPVFIAAIRSEDLYSFHQFLGSFRLHFRTRKLVVYDLGLTSRELKLETLREFGVVFWCHPEMRFTDSSIDDIRSRAEAVGLVTWPAQRFPTSTFTHDAMLSYFGIERRSLYFQHMAEPDTALYVNTYRLHHKLMKPWVLCVLDLECLAPVGTRHEGCDTTRKPRYRYAGCHRYDTSAFNVLLGQMFYFDDTNYIPTNVLFRRKSTLPTVEPHYRKQASPVRSKSHRYSNFSSHWEIQESGIEGQPILFKLKQATT